MISCKEPGLGIGPRKEGTEKPLWRPQAQETAPYLDHAVSYVMAAGHGGRKDGFSSYFFSFRIERGSISTQIRATSPV